MRAEAAGLVGDNLSAEAAPISHNCTTGGIEIRPSPFVYVVDLWEKVVQLLEANADPQFVNIFSASVQCTYVCVYAYTCRVNRLTWHGGAISEEEIWLKIGGDKGGGSFKMSFQLGNVQNPNSPTNTCVFAVFEYRESPHYSGHVQGTGRLHNKGNVEARFTNHKIKIKKLCKSLNRGKRVRMFVYGDYDFLCNLFGLSGASGG